jgi:glycosyltransferase involved in cell wall biosynthesis
MAIGRPILTTQAPGCKDTVEEGYNGWTVPKKDSYELSKRMIWFIQNEDMIDQMGSNSRKFVESEFDVKFVNKKILNLLERN